MIHVISMIILMSEDKSEKTFDISIKGFFAFIIKIQSSLIRIIILIT